MKKNLLDNAVIINGEVHQYVEVNDVDECEYCSLRGLCLSLNMEPCAFMDETKGHHFELVGTLNDVLNREDKRKHARHLTAVLTQYLLYINDAGSARRAVSRKELNEALTFAIRELKEKYK